MEMYSIIPKTYEKFAEFHPAHPNTTDKKKIYNLGQVILYLLLSREKLKIWSFICQGQKAIAEVVGLQHIK